MLEVDFPNGLLFEVKKFVMIASTVCADLSGKSKENRIGDFQYQSSIDKYTTIGNSRKGLGKAVALTCRAGYLSKTSRY